MPEQAESMQWTVRVCAQVLLHVKEKVEVYSVSTPLLSNGVTDWRPLASLHITEEFMGEVQLHFD